MPDAEDILAREVAISAKLEESGVSVRAKSRTVAAFDRLFGSLADWPAAVLEGRAAKRRLRDEIDQRLLEAQGEIAERKLKGLGQAGDPLLIEVLRNEGRRQANKAGVALETLEEMKELPPPTEPPPSEATDDPGGDPDQLDEDWMNQFMRFAEDASSDQLQQLWGRVLAGEVNRPGSFSRHTLRFISELDRTTAEHCEFVMERSVGDFIPKTDEWSTSDHLRVALDLQRLGLLEGVSGLGGFNQSFDFSGGPKTFIKGQKVLVVYGQPGTQAAVPAIIITRLGQEVLSLLKPSDPEPALRNLATLLATQETVLRIELGPWIPVDGGLRYITEVVLLNRA